MEKAKPSRTACKVALTVITLGSKPGMERVLPPGIVDATEALLLASGAIGERIVKWSRTKSALFLNEAIDWMVPGQFEAYGHRKAFCEGQAREGISAGATQILVLGAGYDTLGWRLAPEFPGVSFFEIDHPATAALKARGIHKMGQPKNLLLIPEDLGQRKLVDVLHDVEPWQQTQRTVIIAEGLVMYLSPAAVRDLFHQSSAISGPGSRMVFSFIPTGNDGRPDVGSWTGLMLWIQKLIGENFLWSIRPEELGPFLEETGWALIAGLEGTMEKQGVEYFAAAERRPS